MATTVKPLNFSGTSADDFVIGADGNDVIRGNGGNDTLIGGAGRDSLDGGDGNDILSAGSGDDSLRGGNGEDLYIAGVGNQRFSDVSNDRVFGRDTLDFSELNTAVSINVSVSFSATTTNEAGVVNRYSGTFIENFIGTDQADTFLLKDASIPTISGDIAFQLTGGGGADTFTLGTIVTDAGDELMPTVTDFTIGEDVIGVDAGLFNIGETVPVLDENGNPVIEVIEVDGEVFELPVTEFVESALSFQNVARDGEGVDAGLVGVEAGHNVYVLQGAFANEEAAADALALALAGGEIDEGAGFGFYFDDSVQSLRVFYTTDLDAVEADAAVMLNLETGLDAQATIDLVPLVVADDFLFI